jgi:predicted nucleotidyltransferase
MIGKNNINIGDFLIIRENLNGLNSYGRKAEVALEACRRILDAGLDGLDAILLFGSVARGEDDRRSDVDLLLLYASDEDALRAEDKTAKIAAEIPDANISIINKSFKELSSNPHFAFEVLRDGF